MRRHRAAAVLALATGLVLAAGAPVAAAVGSSTLFAITDHRVDEASGIARGHTSPGVYYVQNDSGDSARFFAVDARTGQVRAVFRVPGAANHDWEDLAVAPDARGVWSVWLADIGDNQARRGEVQLYRVDEPHVSMSRFGAVDTTAIPDEWRLRYPGGPVNAESLAVSPSGRAYVVTKSDTGHSRVYAVPPAADRDRVQALTGVGAISLPARPSIVPSRLQVLATGAALSADGSQFVVRTYTDAYLWRVRGGNLAAAIRVAPQHVVLPLQRQGEGVCLVGDALVIDSEGVGAEVLRVPLPARARPSSSSSSASASSATTSPSAAVASSAATSPSAAPRTTADPDAERSHRGVIVIAVVLGTALVAALAAVGTVRRRRPRA